MAAPTQSTPASAASRLKPVLWTVMALAALSVFFSSEMPLLRDTPGLMHDYRLQLIHDRLFFLPHALAGTTAFLIGPFQFSTRLRRKYLQAHRISGRVYVAAVFIAGLSAISIHLVDRDILIVTGATVFQAGLWMLCTLCALLTARNRHITAHRQWMIRSYAMTFTFVTLRILNVFPRYLNLAAVPLAFVIIIGAALSALLPDIFFNWRELTHKRA